MSQAASLSDEHRQQGREGQTPHEPPNSLVHAAGSQSSLHSYQIRAPDVAPIDDSAAVTESVANLRHPRNVSMHAAPDHSGETLAVLPHTAGVLQMVYLGIDFVTVWLTQCHQALLPHWTRSASGETLLVASMAASTTTLRQSWRMV